jgi:uncharacterized protein YndB with AHSA1/START domain
MGTKNYAVTVDINAQQAAVWAVLSDVEAWPSWTPTMTSIRATGDKAISPGAGFEIRQPGLRPARFVVTSCEDGKSFAWESRTMGVTTVADHVLTSTGPGTTRVELSISMSGPGVGLLWSLVGAKVRRFVDTEASSLAAACGSGADEIVPDDKNWTWVLEKECGECRFDASRFDARMSGEAIRDLAARWSAVLARDSVNVRPRPGVWSPLEYGCHVRDVFRIMDGRVRLMLAEDDPHFENWDQDKTAIEDNYGAQIAAEVAAQLRDSAEMLALRFDGVSGDQWSLRGLRSDGSAFTVESIAKYLMHDPVHHLWDVGADIPAY